MRLLARLQRYYLELVTERRTIHGLPTVVINTRADIDTSRVFERLDAALELLRTTVPHHYRRFRRDFREVYVYRQAFRGAFYPESRRLFVELTFVGGTRHPISEVAATVLHEGMHARLHARGIASTTESQAEHERFCRRAEVEFGRMLPDGQPIVERALDTIRAPDEQVRYHIDPVLAAHRVREADVDSLGLPRWVKWILKRRLQRRAAGRRNNAA